MRRRYFLSQGAAERRFDEIRRQLPGGRHWLYEEELTRYGNFMAAAVCGPVAVIERSNRRFVGRYIPLGQIGRSGRRLFAFVGTDVGGFETPVEAAEAAFRCIALELSVGLTAAEKEEEPKEASLPVGRRLTY